MSTPNQEDHNRLISRPINRPAVHVDCSEWSDVVDASNPSMRRLKSVSETRPAQVVDCSMWPQSEVGETEVVLVSFPDAPDGLAPDYATDLYNHLRQSGLCEINVQRVREDCRTMDLGTVLAISLQMDPILVRKLILLLRCWLGENCRVDDRETTRHQIELLEQRLENCAVEKTIHQMETSLNDTKTQLEELQNDLKQMTLRKGGQMHVGYVSSSLLTIVMQLVDKAKK